MTSFQKGILDEFLTNNLLTYVYFLYFFKVSKCMIGLIYEKILRVTKCLIV